MLFSYNQKKKGYAADAKPVREEFARESTVKRLAGFGEPDSRAQFDPKPAFKTGLSRASNLELLEQKVARLQGELRAQKISHDAAKRQNASLKADLETYKRRESVLLEMLEHERDDGRPTVPKPHEVDPADLERVRRTFAPRLSGEDIVKMVRSVRDDE